MGRTNPGSKKADLARAGTMELTSKEGQAYLEKNLTEWKKPLLLAPKNTATDTTADDDDNESDDDTDIPAPPAKKAKLSKATTMDVTKKEGKDLLGGKKLGDTRQVTKAAQKKAAMKRAGTMQQAVAEAEAVYGSTITLGGKRPQQKKPAIATSAKKSKPAVKKGVKKTKTVEKSSPKKSPTKKTVKKGAMKKYGTMNKTAKEAKQLLGGVKLGDTRQVTKAKQGTK